MPERQQEKYLPAFGTHALTGLYDILCSIFMPEKRFRTALLQQLSLSASFQVLDIGCGTGTQMRMLKKDYPSIGVCGIDGDINILRIAGKKARKASLQLPILNAMSFKLPYFDNVFDRVLSTLMFHHLSPENKKLTAQEVFRVLKPKGELHVADFGKPHNALMNYSAKIFSRFEQNKENVEGRLVEIFRHNGFVDVEVRQNFQTIFGTLALYRAVKHG